MKGISVFKSNGGIFWAQAKFLNKCVLKMSKILFFYMFILKAYKHLTILGILLHIYECYVCKFLIHYYAIIRALFNYLKSYFGNFFHHLYNFPI